MKGKIITTNEKIYSALNRLRHETEVVIEKPIDYKALDRILSNNTNVIAIGNGKNIVLKRLNDFKFDIYLKRVW
jgi:hypothetical protein